MVNAPTTEETPYRSPSAVILDKYCGAKILPSSTGRMTMSTKMTGKVLLTSSSGDQD